MSARPVVTLSADDGSVGLELEKVGVGSDKEPMFSILRVLTETRLSLTERLQESLDILLEALNARSGSILLAREEAFSLQVMAATRREIIGESQPLSKDAVAAYVFRTKRPLMVSNPEEKASFPSSGSNYDTPRYICVPFLSSARDVIGVLCVTDHVCKVCLTQDDMEMAITFAAWISPILENMLLVDSLRREKRRYQALSEELEIKNQEVKSALDERTHMEDMILHDLKSPLTAVISNLDMIDMENKSDEDRVLLAAAKRGIDQIMEMIRNFLKLTHVDQWRIEGGTRSPVPLRMVAEQVAEGMEPIARARGISILMAAADNPIVLGNYTLLHHLFQNLLSNAVRFSPRDSRVVIGWRTAPARRVDDINPNFIKIWVEDNGLGLTEEAKREIFDRILERRSSWSRSLDGSGIGLFICHKVVTLLGGRIWIEDVEPAGARFCFSLFMDAPCTK